MEKSCGVTSMGIRQYKERIINSIESMRLDMLESLEVCTGNCNCCSDGDICEKTCPTQEVLHYLDKLREELRKEIDMEKKVVWNSEDITRYCVISHETGEVGDADVTELDFSHASEDYVTAVFDSLFRMKISLQRMEDGSWDWDDCELQCLEVNPDDADEISVEECCYNGWYMCFDSSNIDEFFEQMLNNGYKATEEESELYRKEN